VPILSDASIGDAVNVGGDEVDRLALALHLPEASCEVTVETQVRDDTITGHDHLLNLAADIRDCEAYQLRGCQRSGKSIRHVVAGSASRAACWSSVVSHLIHLRSSTKIE
jgi:hypothetical protein